MTTPFDVGEADRLLTTTRAVRRRLDLSRPVSDGILFDCIDVAEQAPTGGNEASRRWMVVRDPVVRARLGEIYERSGEFMTRLADRVEGTGHPKEGVFTSGAHLVRHLANVPVLVIVAIWGVHDGSGRPGLFDSVIQSAWSFNLALRARGLGTAWTTMLNANVDELAEVLGIPEGVTTIVTFPVAYTVGDDFSPVRRRRAAEITYFDQWGFTRDTPSEDGTARVRDGQGVVAEIDIAARRSRVWPLVSDIATPVAFSRELQAVEWIGDERSAGARFAGHNKIGDFAWDVECHVTECTEPDVFEWAVTDPHDPGAVWRFELTDMGQSTRLRFSMRIGERNNGTAPYALKDPTREEHVLNKRRSTIKANMQATIEGIKALAEAVD